jgi:GntR family transcriptional regulator
MSDSSQRLRNAQPRARGRRRGRASTISAAPDPLYLQVYQLVADAIATGELRPGNRLPSERAICSQLGVSRATVRRALRQLVDDGLVEASVGRGSFVSATPLAEPPNALMSFSELAALRGLTPSAKLLRTEVHAASPEEAQAFRIEPGDPIFELERLRLLDREPVAMDRSRVPLAVAPKLVDRDFRTDSLFETLEAAGAAPVRGEVSVGAVAAHEVRAEHLRVAAGTPLVVCTTMSYDAALRLVEISEVAYRGDRYRFRATLTRLPR